MKHLKSKISALHSKMLSSLNIYIAADEISVGISFFLEERMKHLLAKGQFTGLALWWLADILVLPITPLFIGLARDMRLN